jgi:Flp pilus assembly protein TadG
VTGRHKSARRGAAGLAAVEFAILVPFFALLLAFMIDAGGAIYARAQVQNAAQIGARYAQVNGWNSVAIAAAVATATDLANVSALPAPQLVCGCPIGTAITVLTVSCTAGVPVGTVCAGTSPAQAPGRYIVVGAQYTYSAPLAFANWPSVMSLKATATTRLD